MHSETKQTILLFLSALAVWIGLRWLLPLAFPFLMGAAMAMAAEPGVRFLARKLPRSAAAGIGVSGVFLAICTLVTVLLAFLFRELGLLAGILPDMERTVVNGLDALRSWLLSLSQGTSPGIRSLIQRNVNDLFSGGAAMLDQFTHKALELAGNLLTQLPDSALGIGTSVLSAFLISSELPKIRQWVDCRVSGRWQHRFTGILARLKSTAGLWLLAQVKLSCITLAMLTAGFLLLRVKYALLCAFVVALLDALPILGTGAVLLPWSIVCFLQSDSPRAIGLLGLYILISLTRSTLEPKFIGRQLGLDPLVTLIALYTGFRLWGFAGLLLAPLFAMSAAQLLVKRE